MVTAIDAMNVTLDSIIHAESWDDASVEAVHRAMAADPELAARVWAWVQLCDHAGRNVDAAMPPLDDLIARAMDPTCSSPAYASACAMHPSLERVVDRLADDITAFDSAWNRSIKQPATLRRVRFVQWAAAAVVVAAVALSVLLLDAPDSIRFASTSGGSEVVELQDGSSVRLVDGAELIVNPAFPRQVQLTGRAWFDVSPREDDPFSVTTDHAITTVAGTTFGVEALLESTVVSVVSGNVLVQAAGKTVPLNAGWYSRVVAGAEPSTPEVLSNLSDLAWTGLFIFRDTPIDSVAAILGQDFKVRIEVDRSLSTQSLTGTFDRDQGLEEILGVVVAALGAELQTIEADIHYRMRAAPDGD